MLEQGKIEEIEDRLCDITPGYWTWIATKDEIHISASSGDKRLGCTYWENMITVYGCEEIGKIGMRIAAANAKFIVNASDDIRLLLNEVRRLNRKVARLEQKQRDEADRETTGGTDPVAREAGNRKTKRTLR